uniref:Uncharacterized protein n=1 Tax=viral metagenome TaxID=1070528 RepID=A0A6H1ZV77_9ZZZZ
MSSVTITCKACGKAVTVQYPSVMGHSATEEAIAMERAVRQHECSDEADARAYDRLAGEMWT